MYASEEKRRDYERKYYEMHKEKIRARKAEQMRVRRNKYPDTFRVQKMSYRQAMRQRLLDLYGCKCAVCGYSDARALTLDHIHGNGNTERKKLGETGVYRLAVKFFQPDVYRTLCMNCQFIEYKERSKPQPPTDCLAVNDKTTSSPTNTGASSS